MDDINDPNKLAAEISALSGLDPINTNNEEEEEEGGDDDENFNYIEVEYFDNGVYVKEKIKSSVFLRL